jgi:hypothetical protein
LRNGWPAPLLSSRFRLSSRRGKALRGAILVVGALTILSSSAWPPLCRRLFSFLRSSDGYGLGLIWSASMSRHLLKSAIIFEHGWAYEVRLQALNRDCLAGGRILHSRLWPSVESRPRGLA